MVGVGDQRNHGKGISFFYLPEQQNNEWVTVWLISLVLIINGFCSYNSSLKDLLVWNP